MIQIKSKKIPVDILQDTLTGALGDDFRTGQGLIYFKENAVMIGGQNYPLPLHLETLKRALVFHGLIKKQEMLTLGDMTLNTQTRLLQYGDKKVLLTERENMLLAYFLTHPDDEVTKTDLLTQVWGWHEGVQTHTIESHICALRVKCAPYAQIMTTEQGYRFCLSDLK